MRPPAHTQWLPSHLVVNPAHVAIRKETIRTWEGNGNQTPALPKWLPSHLVVNPAHVAICKETIRTW